jgi:hypothetical protein
MVIWLLVIAGLLLIAGSYLAYGVTGTMATVATILVILLAIWIDRTA